MIISSRRSTWYPAEGVRTPPKILLRFQYPAQSPNLFSNYCSVYIQLDQPSMQYSTSFRKTLYWLFAGIYFSLFNYAINKSPFINPVELSEDS
jgi:hypothetical protein